MGIKRIDSWTYRGGKKKGFGTDMRIFKSYTG